MVLKNYMEATFHCLQIKFYQKSAMFVGLLDLWLLMSEGGRAEKLPKNTHVDIVITWSLTESFANPWSKQCTGAMLIRRVLLVVQVSKHDIAEDFSAYMVIARKAWENNDEYRTTKQSIASCKAFWAKSTDY